MTRRSPIASKTGWPQSFDMAVHTRAFLCLRDARGAKGLLRISSLERNGKEDRVPAAQDEKKAKKIKKQYQRSMGDLPSSRTRKAIPRARTPDPAGWFFGGSRKPAPITSSRRYLSCLLVVPVNLQLSPPNQVPGRMTRSTLPSLSHVASEQRRLRADD